MTRILRALFGCSRRERTADAASRRQAEDHAIAMQAMALRVEAAEAAAKESERAAQALLRRLQEGWNR